MPGFKRSKRGFKWYYQRGKILIEDGCWIWLGAQNEKGYPNIRQWKNGRWTMVRGLHYFIELYRGPILPGFEAAHTCHRRLCVNPRHGVPKVQRDNKRDWYIPVDTEDHQKIRKLFFEGHTISHIADQVRAPRPAVRRYLSSINLRQVDIFDDIDPA